MLNESIKQKIQERIGTDFFGDGLSCPNCGAWETYKSTADKYDVDKWVFAISAFKVDNISKCCNCGAWFG